MITKKWTTYEEAELKRLAWDRDPEDIAKILSSKKDGVKFHPRSAEAVRRKIERLERTRPKTDTATSQLVSLQGQAAVPTQTEVVDAHWKQLNALVNSYMVPQQVRQPGIVTGPRTKTLILSDIHFPWAHTEFLRQALDAHPDATNLVLNGDIIEGYAFSTFEKNKEVAALDEYRCAFEFIASVRDRFERIILVEGNHDARVSKYLQRQGVAKTTWDYLRPNLLSRLAAGERLDRKGNVVELLDFSNVYHDPREPWWIKIGKALIFHPHKAGGSAPGAGVTAMGTKLATRYREDEVDALIMGHSHKVYKGIINGRLYMEQGCMASMLSYFFGPDYASNRTYQNGYAVLVQDQDGNTDFNASQVIYLGECLANTKLPIGEDEDED